MISGRFFKLLHQRTIINKRYLYMLMVVSLIVLTGETVAVVQLCGYLRLFAAAAVLGTLLLIYHIGILLYTCVDQSEFQIHGLRQKLYLAAQNNTAMPPEIQMSIWRLAHRRHNAMTCVAAQRDVALNNTVVRILEGNLDSLEQINQALAPYALTLQGKSYVLSLFHTLEIPDDAFDLNVENSLRAFGYPNPLAAFFRTIIGEMYGTVYSCLICESNGIFRCIVTTENADKVSELEQEVLAISNRIIQVFKTCLSITMLGAVSQAQTDFSKIRTSSEELNRLMECRSFLGDARTVLTHTDLDLPAQQQYQHSLRQQQGLLTLLEARQFREARDACKEMLQTGGSGDSFLLSRLLIRNTAYACIFSMPIAQNELQHFSEQLQGAKSLSDYADFFEALISFFEKQSASTSTASWVAEMANYIDQHFMEKDLTVSSLSDLFHYNPIYATKVFKQETGLNISEYIQRKRLDNSRKMLGKGYTVKEIADACGFSSAASMNRIYGKEFGTTPGKLNESHALQNTERHF